MVGRLRGAAAFALWSLLATARAALSHPGHGDPRWVGTILHYWLEPEHVPATGAVALGIAVLAWRLGRVFSTRSGGRDRES